ncbi:MAG TPA: hypothetical protein VNY33_05210 [Gaiellaceae bacterium]|nr:hypothetical protein [Gaiellaceae bacterium]
MFGHFPELFEPGVVVDGVVVDGVVVDGAVVVVDGVVVDEPDAALAIAAPPPATEPATASVTSAVRKRPCIVGYPLSGAGVFRLVPVQTAPL